MIKIPKLYKEWGIYKIENIETGKVYIGSSGILYYRLSTHLRTLRKGCHSNSYLQNAWNKYGESKFKIDILEITKKNKKYLLQREDYYLQKFQSFNRDKGYNIFEFASSPKGCKWSNEARKGILGRGKGRKNSEETIEKMKNSALGRKMSKQSINKMIESREIPIIMLDLNGKFVKEWESIKKASIWLGITPSVQICRVLKKKSKTCKNYQFIYKDEYDINKNYEISKGKQIKVTKYNLNNKLLKEYNSLQEASFDEKVPTTNISKCCKGIRKTCKGFIWKYKI